ncbi:MAG TPA: hypothetical protein EYQ01_01550 [Nitrospira sp.]|nr:hypothetical protein [Candidatus Manganitrophaceae bacterium]
MIPQEEIIRVAMNATLLILFCLVHSLLAREFVKAYIEQIIHRGFYRFTYVLLAIFTLTAVMYFWQPIEGFVWHAEDALYWILNIVSYGCVFGGVYSIYIINYVDFFGIGSLLPGRKNIPDKPLELSTKGPYAYCRHPMYLFFGLAGFSRPVMSYGDLEFLIIAAIYIAIAIPLEERNLRNELGEIYDTYRAHVPAIIPKLTPWRYIS